MKMFLPARFLIFPNNLYREEYLFSLLDLVEWSDIVDIMHCERNILYFLFLLVTIVKNHCNKTHVNQRVNDVTA